MERALEAGLATSASLMVPCPWAYDAVLRTLAHPDWEVGVHLTLTAEWPRYRWPPLLPADRTPGLRGPDGFLWPGTADVHSHATAEEALAESVAQVERALAWGLRPSHLDSHMGVHQTQPVFFEVYLTVAARFDLPVRMAGERELAAAARGGAAWAAEARAMARARGVAFAGDLLLPGRRPPEEDHGAFLRRALAELPAGTTEIFFHPCEDGEETRAVMGERAAAERAADLRTLTDDGPGSLRRALAGSGARLVRRADVRADP